MHALVDRYIARLMFVPLAATLLVSAMLLLLVRMAELFDFVIDEGGTGGTVLRLLANLMPQYLALGLPLGLLMGVLLAFRRLALSSELDAMLATGVSYARLLKVPMLYAAGLALLTVGVVGFIQPLSAYGHEKLMFDLNNGRMGFSIRVGEFTHLGDKVVVRAERSRHGGRDLSGVFATVTDAKGRMVVFSAARGELRPAADGETMIARLFDGTLARLDTESGTNQSTHFAAYEIPLNLPSAPVFRKRGEHEREMTLPELFSLAGDAAAPPTMKRQAEAGIFRRAAQVLVLFFLPLLGMAFARPPRRSHSGIGVFLGLASFIIYNELSLFGERLGFTGQVVPLPAQAASFLPFAGLCVAVFLVSAFKAGEPPLSRISALLSNVIAWIRPAPLAPGKGA